MVKKIKLNKKLEKKLKFKKKLIFLKIKIFFFDSPVPLFLQFDEPNRLMFSGVSEVAGFRTLYEMIDLEKMADRLKTLSGLVDLFKEKIVSHSKMSIYLDYFFQVFYNTVCFSPSIYLEGQRSLRS
jgi:hypothetical protein